MYIYTDIYIYSFTETKFLTSNKKIDKFTTIIGKIFVDFLAF